MSFHVKLGISSGGRTGGWGAAAPLVGQIRLERVFSPAQKWLTLKKNSTPGFRSHPSQPLTRSHSHPATCDARCAAPAPLYRRRPPPPLVPGAPAGRLFLCPSPLRAALPPLLHLHASADHAAAPTAGSPGQRGRPAPSRQPASQRPPPRPASGQRPASQPYCPWVTQ